MLVVAGALIGALLNGLVERLAFRPFDGRREPLGPLIASLALSFLMLGAAVRWHALTSVPMPGHQGVNLPLLAMPDIAPVARAWLLRRQPDPQRPARAADRRAGGGRRHAGPRRAAGAAGCCAPSPRTRSWWRCSAANPRRGRLFGFLAAGALTGVAAAIFAAYYGGDQRQSRPAQRPRPR